MYLPMNNKTLSNSNTIQKACDSIRCHTLKPNSPRGRHKNIDNDIHNEFSSTNPSTENKISFNHKNDFDSPKIENYIIQDDVINKSNSSKDQENIIKKNNASLGLENFQLVTVGICYIQ